MNEKIKLATDLKIRLAMRDAEDKAWDALSRYKFWMFGYHASNWVNLNKLLDEREPSPFACAVKLGKIMAK